MGTGMREDRMSDAPEGAGPSGRVSGGKTQGDLGGTPIPADSRAGVEPAAIWTETAALRPWVNNPKKITAADVAQVVASIRRFGFGAPIVARLADGEVLAGHKRLKAAQELGLTRVPVRYLDLDSREAHLYALADNQMAEDFEQNDAEVASNFAQFSEEERELVSSFEKELVKLSDTLDSSLEDGPMGAVEPYSIVIECSTEAERARVMARLRAEGLACHATL